MHYFGRLFGAAETLRARLLGAKTGGQENDRATVRRFNRLYYDRGLKGGTWRRTSWLGAPAQKAPTDLWAYQEILHELRPDLIVETGTADGGSALFLASVCELLGKGRVVSVDISPVGYSGKPRPEHPRIRYLLGSSTDEEIVGKVRKEAEPAGMVLVILDSDHSKAHVLEEMRAYAPLVTPGSYMIVEDTNANGHPVLPDFGPGPMEAVEEFLTGREDFAVDRSREKFLLTFNPKGFLRRIEGAKEVADA